MDVDKILMALKQALKSKGITYRQAAAQLDLSESSIKRLFAEQSFTLVRLNQLCELADTDLAALISSAEAAQPKIEQLSYAQEEAIVNDPKLLLVGVCVINMCRFDEILDKYQFSETELIRYFAKLDRLKVIEYLPGNRYRLILSPQFSWIKNGPIQRFFCSSIMGDYFNSVDVTNGLHYVWGMLTAEAATELNGKIVRLIDDYVQLAKADKKLPMAEKMTSSLLILFRENWEPGVFVEQQVAQMK